MSSRLRRALLTTVALTLVMSATPSRADDTGGGAFSHRGLTCQHERWLRKVHRGRAPDIVIVGSSMAFRGLHTPVVECRTTGLTLHNAASPGMDALMMSMLVRHILLGVEPPPVLMVAISSRDLNTEAVQQSSAWGRFRRSSGGGFIRRGDLAAVLSHLSAGTRVRAATAALRRPDLVDPTFDGWSPAPAGYVPPGWLYPHLFRSRCDQVRDIDWTVFDGADPDQQAAFADRVLDPFDLDRGFAALDAITRRAAAAGTEVILLDLPVPDDYRSAHPGGTATFEQYRTRLAAFATDRGLTLLDAATMFTGHDDMFRDINHLNVHGARRLSRAVGDALDADPGPGVVVLAP